MKLATLQKIFRALGDPIRLRILVLLEGGELCVGDLVDLLGVPQPTASRHLAYLRAAGLVRARKRGRWCFYSLPEPSSGFKARLRACLEECAKEIAELQRDRARARRLREVGGCCDLPPVEEA